MINLRILCGAGTAIILLAGTAAATDIAGNLYSEFYAYETRVPDTVSHLRSLQGFRFDVRDAFYQGFSLYVNGRVASDISNKLSNDPDYRVYGAYAQYQPASGKFMVRAGRQYVYEGLGGFFLDGGRLKFDVGKRASLSGFAGTLPGPSFYTYDQVNKWNSNNAFGGRIHVKASSGLALNASYLQKDIDENLDSRLIGFDGVYAKGRCSNRFRIDYDLYFKRLKLLTIAPQMRFKKGHSVRIEYLYKKPSFGQSSIFSVVKSNPIHQFRLHGLYKAGEELYGSGSVIITKLKDDSYVSLRVGPVYKGQSGGIVFADGYGGSKIGVYGGLNRAMTEDLSLYANIDMYSFKLDTEQDDSETSISGVLGGRYKIFKGLNARAEVQVLSNPLYDYDTRGYLRVDYGFLNNRVNNGSGGGSSK